MSQFETSFPPQDMPQPKMSALAIASLVCSLLFCCPLGTIPGILLGIGALVSISGNPMRRGKGLAITGIVLGVLFTVCQALIYPPAIRLGMDTMALMQNGPSDALSAGFAGDLPAFRSHFFKAGAGATDQEAKEFVDELRSRYGEFVSSYPIQSNSPPFGQTIVVMRYSLEFDRATVSADVELVFADPNTGEWAAKVGSITVNDAERGDLAFPPQPAEPRPAGAPSDGG